MREGRDSKVVMMAAALEDGQRTMMAKVDNDSGGRQWHARLGSGLRRGWTRAGGERRQRHRVAMTAAVADHGGGGHVDGGG